MVAVTAVLLAVQLAAVMAVLEAVVMASQKAVAMAEYSVDEMAKRWAVPAVDWTADWSAAAMVESLAVVTADNSVELLESLKADAMGVKSAAWTVGSTGKYVAGLWAVVMAGRAAAMSGHKTVDNSAV